MSTVEEFLAFLFIIVYGGSFVAIKKTAQIDQRVVVGFKGAIGNT